jgi:hypothetical protein
LGIVNVSVPPPATRTSKEPSSAVTVWVAVSLLAIVNSVPAVTDAAPNDVFWMVSAAGAELPAAAVVVLALLPLLLQAVAPTANKHAAT